MNKIFKVLWNRARSARVVTDETKTACGKGRQGATTVVAAAVLAAGAFTLALPVQASEITPDGNWSHKTITGQGGRYDIHTDKFLNGNKTGVNHFDKFNLSSGNIANLHFDNAAGTISADRLVNFVNQKISVDGTVNAVKGGKIDGDLVFVSPQGMVVGTTGVINAGSFTAIAPKTSDYDEWIGYLHNNSDAILEDHFNEAFWTNLESGNVPLNPDAVITVAGSINAGNRIALAAANIEIQNGAQLKTGVDDFADLVNIKDADGSVTVSAGLAEDALALEVDEDSGDILLVARSDAKASGQADLPEESSGTTEAADIRATITVAEGSTIDAKKDAVILAEAGNTTYDYVNKAWGADTGKQTAHVAAEVVINGTVKAGGDIDAQANAYNKVDHTAGFNLAFISEQIMGAWVGPLANSTVEYVDMMADSSLKIGETASLSAGNDLNLIRSSRSRLISAALSNTPIRTAASKAFVRYERYSLGQHCQCGRRRLDSLRVRHLPALGLDRFCGRQRHA